ncbi:hypothetical protein Ae706Ps2_6187 [Pseudonocardia sp. Ae706_Ps2]|nr:hypothetical protein Ae706Ps2_6187 [Pseudonocardia sp. Ae706_Ps2]
MGMPTNQNHRSTTGPAAANPALSSTKQDTAASATTSADRVLTGLWRGRSAPAVCSVGSVRIPALSSFPVQRFTPRG